MNQTELRTPVIKTICILIIAITVFTVVGTAGDGSIGSGFMSLFSGIGNSLIFGIGLAISIALSIIILIAIFLGAVAMSSRDTASEMYNNLKKKAYC